MSRYLIKLFPTGKFFFGGEMTFQVGDDERDSFNSQYASYIIKSEKFPQQTSLLGMLRFLLLRKSDYFDCQHNKIKSECKDDVGKLIGKTSFMKGKTGGYGKINRIGPCFLMKNGKPICLLPKDFGSKEKGGIKRIVLNNKTSKYNDREIVITEILRYPTESEASEGKQEENWTAKDGLKTLYWDGENYYEEEILFIKDQRIGINRDIDTGKTQDNALFKQISYRLAEGCCFAFYADIDMDVKEYNGEIVSLGADSSQFKIEITDKDIPQVKLPEDFQPELEGEIGRVVLESPAYISDDTLKKACFSITGTIPFKFMETTIETDDYSRLGKKIFHSKRYELYQTGSVFYFLTEKEMKDFISAIEGQRDFYDIGYNHIMNIK